MIWTISKKQLEVKINDDVMEIVSVKNGGLEFTYQQDSEWKKSNPTMFPICGGLIDNKYKHNGLEYSMNRHGFWRELKEWKIVEQNGSSISFIVNSNGNYKNIYPFEFKIKYTILINDNDEIEILTEINNLSAKNAMYFNFGHHPSFLVDKNNGIITYDKVQKFTNDITNDGFFKTNMQTTDTWLNKKMEDIDFTNGAYIADTSLDANEFIYEDEMRKIIMKLNDFPNMLIWSPSNKEKFACFEPWMGIPDVDEKRSDREIANKIGIQSLLPGNSYKNILKIKYIKK
ncbi:hypothetical protein [Spiroplasma endosymbiont of Labia minor]|uniref:aldose epimerase family protein n=1 Tax=Spiroplasma endosymbiont of Labia minor TaxID=3066305 RepID=UPI0030CECA34